MFNKKSFSKCVCLMAVFTLLLLCVQSVSFAKGEDATGYLPKCRMSVDVGGYVSTKGSKANLIDNDLNTQQKYYWESQADANGSHWICINLGNGDFDIAPSDNEYYVSGLTFYRQEASIKTSPQAVTVSYSADSANGTDGTWTSAGSYDLEWDAASLSTDISFEEVAAKYVKITIDTLGTSSIVRLTEIDVKGREAYGVKICPKENYDVYVSTARTNPGTFIIRTDLKDNSSYGKWEPRKTETVKGIAYEQDPNPTIYIDMKQLRNVSAVSLMPQMTNVALDNADYYTAYSTAPKNAKVYISEATDDLTQSSQLGELNWVSCAEVPENSWSYPVKNVATKQPHFYTDDNFKRTVSLPPNIETRYIKIEVGFGTATDGKVSEVEVECIEDLVARTTDFDGTALQNIEFYSKNAVTPAVIAAVFDKSTNNLTSVQLAAPDIAASSNYTDLTTVRLDNRITVDETEYIKIFAWDSLSNMKPIMESDSYNQ